MARTDFLDDPNAPQANTIIPAVSAIITDSEGRILLQRRSDNGLWGLPGGTMEIGETIVDALHREIKEETGLIIEPTGIVGIYSNPKHVIAYSDGEVRQEFSICFACKVIGGQLKVSDESTGIAFFSHEEIQHLELHSSIRQRIDDYYVGSRIPALR